MDPLEIARQYEKVKDAAEEEARREVWLLDYLPAEEVFAEVDRANGDD
jgi:hypothetical protein